MENQLPRLGYRGRYTASVVAFLTILVGNALAPLLGVTDQ